MAIQTLCSEVASWGTGRSNGVALLSRLGLDDVDIGLAEPALEYGAVVHTADRDFARFKGVRWLNPLQ